MVGRRLQVVVEDLARDATKVVEAVDVTALERLHVLAHRERQVLPAAVAQGHAERGEGTQAAPIPDAAAGGPAHLGLLTQLRLEPLRHHRHSRPQRMQEFADERPPG